jgi:hypothetical protein
VGEAPSRYFFSQLKAKQARDTITSLDVGTEQPATADADLIQAVEDHFQEQFTLDPAVQSNTTKLTQVLAAIQHSISAADNAILGATPSPEEITNTVFSFKRDKSPGLDGITAEMLQSCWDFVGPLCISVVRSFWKDGLLSRQMQSIVIKLIYKGGERSLIKNWCPISL